MNIIEKIQFQLNQLPEQNLVDLLKCIEFLNYKQQVQQSTAKPYDFSDLSGRLQWQGNALQEQKKFRNEW
jgi:hypothetical protein